MQNDEIQNVVRFVNLQVDLRSPDIFETEPVHYTITMSTVLRRIKGCKLSSLDPSDICSLL